MRTISFRLDERCDTLLKEYCERHGVTQTEALKTAIEHIADAQRPKPADLAREMGLIGSFRSREGDLGERHAEHLKQRRREKLDRDSAVTTAAPRRAAR